MKTALYLKKEWPALIAAVLVTAFIICAAITIINLTEAGLINWTR